MARYKPCRYDQMVMVPISFQQQFEPGTLEYTLHELVEVQSQQPTLIEQMKARIDTPQGRQIYARRLAIVEPVFANLRMQKRLDHFTVRSKAKVDVQWKLFALLHNIGKIHEYGRVS